MTKKRFVYRKWCEVCETRTIFNKTYDEGFVCSKCGTKKGGEIAEAKIKNIEKKEQEREEQDFEKK